MKKIALLLALLMLLCCAGCGEKEETPVEQNATGAAQQETTVLPGEEHEEDVCPESEDGKHQYQEELVSEATCTDDGLMMYNCVACQQSITKEIPAFGHTGTGVSCEEPSICTTCGELAEDAWGHDWEGDICKNCGIDRANATPVPQPVPPVETEPEETTEQVETTEATTQQ